MRGAFYVYITTSLCINVHAPLYWDVHVYATWLSMQHVRTYIRTYTYMNCGVLFAQTGCVRDSNTAVMPSAPALPSVASLWATSVWTTRSRPVSQHTNTHSHSQRQTRHDVTYQFMNMNAWLQQLRVCILVLNTMYPRCTHEIQRWFRIV